MLGIAWFGGVVLATVLRIADTSSMNRWKQIGLAWMLVTGALWFWLEPLESYHSISFRVKLTERRN